MKKLSVLICVCLLSLGILVKPGSAILGMAWLSSLAEEAIKYTGGKVVEATVDYFIEKFNEKNNKNAQLSKKDVQKNKRTSGLSKGDLNQEEINYLKRVLSTLDGGRKQHFEINNAVNINNTVKPTQTVINNINISLGDLFPKNQNKTNDVNSEIEAIKRQRHDDYLDKPQKLEPENSNDANLISAAAQGRTREVKKLLKDGANVNARDKHGKTALMLAANNGKTNCVEALLENEANVNEKLDDGSTALMFAAANGRTKIVILLLDYHADVDAENDKGKSARQLARENGHYKTSTILNDN